MTLDLMKVLHAERGVVCCVGAGGKKTTMYRLAAEHPGRVGITATSHIEVFPRNLRAAKYVAHEAELLRTVTENRDVRVLAFATPSERRGRHAGISPDRVAEFRQAGGFDLMLIKADGARGRLIKAPADHEPPIPAAADTVIAVVSAKVMGNRLDGRIAHRLEQLAAVTGARPGNYITPSHVARLLASAKGSLKNAGRAVVVPLINMVDDGARETLAREAAEEALALTGRFRYVVLACMRAEQPVVDVIYRCYGVPGVAATER